MSALDRWIENRSRASARRLGRRHFLAGLGAWLVGASLPLLPVWRVRAADAAAEDPGDPANCDYWRYCAIDGFLCACCGGSHTGCPPGTAMSPITWIGTCQNPGDGKHYVISYNDCCGRSGCGRCPCMRNEGDEPSYRQFSSNNINWCTGSEQDIVYNCSVARIVGVRDD